MFKNFKAVLFGITVALLLCEIILRIYNPFATFTKQGKLILPSNQKTVFENKWITQLDKKINYSRNSLAFVVKNQQTVFTNSTQLLPLVAVQQNANS